MLSPPDAGAGAPCPGVRLASESYEDMKRSFLALIAGGADAGPRNSFSKKALEQTCGGESILGVCREAPAGS